MEVLVRGAELIPEGKQGPISIASYSFNADESKLLIATEVSKIYRRSSKAINYVYELKTKKLKLLVEGDKQSFATFSPDGMKVGFVRDNNLYMVDLSNNQLTAVTSDGNKNEIINGFADWVYEEELSLSKAFFWSPDGSKIAFLKFNEKEVPVYNMQKWNGLYPEDYIYKYPKAGEKNSIVTIHIYDVKSKITNEIIVGNDKDVHIARIQWPPVESTVSIIRLNRLQNKLDLFHADTNTGRVALIYSEISDTYIDIDQVDDLTYMKDGKSFLVSSEKTGFKHNYHYSIDGHFIKPVTKGTWEVSDFKGVDEKKKQIFYTSTKISSIERHLYVTILSGEKTNKLSKESGIHTANFSPDFKYYINTYSPLVAPSKTTLHSASGKLIKILAENSEYLKQSEKYGFAKTEIFKIGIENGDSLNAYIMKPREFNKTSKYPFLMFVYGGPGSQKVMNS